MSGAMPDSTRSIGGMERRHRRHLILGLPLLAPCVLRTTPARAAGGLQPRRLEATEPRPLPEFGFTDAEGAAQPLARFAGRALVVNFWATWCAPCVAEMPALDRLQQAVAEDGITVLALSSDRGGAAQVRPFYERTAIRHLGLWLDPRGAAARAFGVRAVPTTVVTDRRHREVARLAGPAEWDAEPMVAAIRRLAGPPAAPEPERRSI